MVESLPDNVLILVIPMIFWVFVLLLPAYFFFNRGWKLGFFSLLLLIPLLYSLFYTVIGFVAIPILISWVFALLLPVYFFLKQGWKLGFFSLLLLIPLLYSLFYTVTGFLGCSAMLTNQGNICDHLLFLSTAPQLVFIGLNFIIFKISAKKQAARNWARLDL